MVNCEQTDIQTLYTLYPLSSSEQITQFHQNTNSSENASIVTVT